MGFEIIEKLSPNEKARRAREYTKWLQENGYLPDYRKMLIEVHRLTQELIKDLHKQEQNSLAASQLASHIDDILNNLQE